MRLLQLFCVSLWVIGLISGEVRANRDEKTIGKVSINLHSSSLNKFNKIKFTTVDLRGKTQTGIVFTKDKELDRKLSYDGTQYLRISLKNRLGLWKKLVDFRLKGVSKNYSCQFKLNKYDNGPIEIATRGCPIFVPAKKFVYRSDVKIVGASVIPSDQHKVIVRVDPKTFSNFGRVKIVKIDSKGKKHVSKTFKGSKNTNQFIKSSTQWLMVNAGYTPGFYKTIGYLNVGITGDNKDRTGHKCQLAINKNPGWSITNKKALAKAATFYVLSNNINLPLFKKLTRSNLLKVTVSLKGSQPNCHFIPVNQLETIVRSHDYKGDNDMVKVTVDDDSFDVFKSLSLRRVLMNGDVVKEHELDISNNSSKVFKLGEGSRVEIGYESINGSSTYLHRFGGVVPIPIIPTLTIDNTKNDYFAYIMAPYGQGKAPCRIKVSKGPGWYIGAAMGQIIIEKQGKCMVKRLFDDVRVYEGKDGKSYHAPQVLIIDKDSKSDNSSNDNNATNPWRTPAGGAETTGDYGYESDEEVGDKSSLEEAGASSYGDYYTYGDFE